MDSIADHHDDGDVTWFYDKVRPLEEDKAVQDLFDNLEARQATARWRIMQEALDVQTAFAGFDPASPLWESHRQFWNSYCGCITVWENAKHLPWPVPYRGRLLGMVIRQWVEDEPSRAIALQLGTSEEWQRLINSTREGRRETDTRPIAVLEYSLSLQLEWAGLPSNPKIVRHFLAAVEGQDEPLPARGLLVTTLAYVTSPQKDRTTPIPIGFFSPSHETVTFAPPHETTISGVTEWMRGPLLGRAHKVVRAHQEFLHKNAARPHMPTTKRTSYLARRAGQDARLETRTLDYIQEAVETFDPALVPHLSINDSRFVSHCNAVYKRVHERIVYHNQGHSDQPLIPAKPPKHWHQTVFEVMSPEVCRKRRN